MNGEIARSQVLGKFPALAKYQMSREACPVVPSSSRSGARAVEPRGKAEISRNAASLWGHLGAQASRRIPLISRPHSRERAAPRVAELVLRPDFMSGRRRTQ
jgi:hypothetical protein